MLLPLPASVHTPREWAPRPLAGCSCCDVRLSAHSSAGSPAAARLAPPLPPPAANAPLWKLARAGLSLCTPKGPCSLLCQAGPAAVAPGRPGPEADSLHELAAAGVGAGRSTSLPLASYIFLRTHSRTRVRKGSKR